MKLVTGGAGFIGSHVTDALLQHGEDVRVLDNLSTGRKSFLDAHAKNKRFQFQRGDCLKKPDLKKALRDVDEVWHMAADPDVRVGITDPWSNFRDGAVVTFEVLDAMRRADVKRILFASSSTVYGDTAVRPTPEAHGPNLPISAYGASKLAGEALVSAYTGTFGLQGWIFRFGNVVGPRVTHGVVYDFHERLRKNPRRLTIYGSGTQTKSYLSEVDCVQGMLLGRDATHGPCNVLNLASGSTTNVVRIAELVAQAMGLKSVQFEFTGGDRGWKGDVPLMELDIRTMRELGWRPKHTSDQAIQRAAESLIEARPKARPSSRRPR